MNIYIAILNWLGEFLSHRAEVYVLYIEFKNYTALVYGAIYI